MKPACHGQACRLFLLLQRAAGALTLGAMLVCSPAEGREPPYLEELIARARQHRLAERLEWRALLHYEPDLVGSGVTSLIDSPRFFRAPDGKTDPQAELEATLVAFFVSVPETDPAQPPQCAMIARYHWLKAQFGFDSERLPEQRCSQFEQWYAAIDPSQLTLVFPTAYLNNPSSMFGHTLLRIDRLNQDEHTRLVSYAINFGADTGADGGVLFAVRGLIGDYRGYFSLMPYYQRVRTYSDIENRDIWEYQLNFTRDEVDRLLEHLWELDQQYVDYFFFSTNCSYVLLSLLNVAKPTLRLTEGFGLYAIPVDTVRAVVEKSGLLKKAVFRPSGRTRIEEMRRRLSGHQQRLALELAKGEVEPEGPELAALGLADRAAIIDLAQSYVQYQLDVGRWPREVVAPRSLKLLRARAQIETSPGTPTVSEPAVRPDRGHRTARVTAGFGATDGRWFGEFRLRSAYHDLLDPSGGFVPGAAIDFLDVQLRYYEGRGPTVERATLVGIESLTPRNELFQPVSWRLDAGIERFRNQGGDLGDLVFKVGGGAGPTWALGDGALVSGFVDASLFADGDWPNGRLFGIGPSASLTWPINPWWTLRLEGGWQLLLGGEVTDRFAANLNQGFALSRNVALRVGAALQNDGDTTYPEWSLSAHWYF